MNDPGNFPEHLKKQYEQFKKIIEKKKEMLVIVHNNPDPDALASAFVLCYLAKELSDMKTSIAYGGNIGRIENKTMVSRLNIKLKQINRIKFSKYDVIALVDTQPGYRNNSCPDNLECNIVIDHHPRRKSTKADLLIINPDIGATASILVSWLKYSKINIPVNVATALSYAISSETQNMYREVSAFDIEAYLYIYPKSSIRKLASIINPPLPHDYYLFFLNALNNAVIHRNLVVSHLGTVSSPELIAEMADFFLRHRNISWCLCSGLYKDSLYLSLRSTRRKAKANKIIKSIADDKNNAGGHDQTAGGFIKLANKKKEEIESLYTEINIAVAKKTGNITGTNKIEFKPLVSQNLRKV